MSVKSYLVGKDTSPLHFIDEETNLALMPKFKEGETTCKARSRLSFGCTRAKGHPQPHIAIGYRTVCDMWEDN